VLPSITAALPAFQSQNGFRPFRSTTTAFLPLVSQISEGFNEKKPGNRSAAVAVDISKVFHTVNITLLLDMISDYDLHPNYVRWLATYLR
jgi:hypothetical protein